MSSKVLKRASRVQFDLINLDHEAKDICQRIINAGGEMNQEIEKVFDANSISTRDAIDRARFAEDQLYLQGEHYQKLAGEFNALAKRYEIAGDRIRELMKRYMITHERRELCGNLSGYRMAEMGEKLVITDETQIPSSYKRIEYKEVIDKERIRSALEQGESVPGAELEKFYALRHFAGNGS